MFPTVAMAAALCSFAIATSTANGVADPSRFDHGGRVATIGGLAWPSGREQTAVTGDGRIYVAAVPGRGGAREAVRVRRYLPDGELDPGFGAAGTVVLGELGGGGFRFDDLLVDTDGLPYLVGSTEAGETVVARLRPSGKLDPTYGEGGVARLASLPTRGVRPRAVIDQENRVIVAAGVVARLDPSGELDSTFGTGGTVPLPDRTVEGLGVDAEGRVQLALRDRDGGNGFRLVRLDEDGRPDPSLGPTGTRTFRGIGAVRAMAVRSDGSTLLVGTAAGRQPGGVAVPLMSIGSRGIHATTPRWVHRFSAHLPGRSYVSAVASDPNGDDYLVGTQVTRHQGLVVDLTGEGGLPQGKRGEHVGGTSDRFGRNQRIVIAGPEELIASGASITGSGGRILVDGIARPRADDGPAHGFLAEFPTAEHVIYYVPESP
jgi:uncharacterized delta-60 repeat protein